MEWELIVALVVMVPVILLPVAFVWYLNLGGILAAVRRAGATDKERLAPETKAT